MQDLPLNNPSVIISPTRYHALITVVFGLIITSSAQVAMAQDTTLPEHAHAPSAATSSVPVVGRLAPSFRMNDLNGKVHTLGEFRKHPTIVHFFCGCDSCHTYARTWATAQSGAKNGVTSLVIYLGEPKNARKFLQDTGLKLSRNIILPDPDFQTGLVYNALDCPRVFVVDGQGVLRFTNNKKRLPSEAEKTYDESTHHESTHHESTHHPIPDDKPSRTILSVLEMVEKMVEDSPKPPNPSTSTNASPQEEYQCAALYR